MRYANTGLSKIEFEFVLNKSLNSKVQYSILDDIDVSRLIIKYVIVKCWNDFWIVINWYIRMKIGCIRENQKNHAKYEWYSNFSDLTEQSKFILHIFVIKFLRLGKWKKLLPANINFSISHITKVKMILLGSCHHLNFIKKNWSQLVKSRSTKMW